MNRLTKLNIFTLPTFSFDNYYVDLELYIFYNNQKNSYINLCHQEKIYDDTNYMYDLMKISQTIIYTNNTFVNSNYSTKYRNIIDNQIKKDHNSWSNVISIVKIKDVY
jgi:hypothetical protein